MPIFYFTKHLKFSIRSSENIGLKGGIFELFLTFHTFCIVYF